MIANTSDIKILIDINHYSYKQNFDKNSLRLKGS